MKVMILTADYPPVIWSGIGTAVTHQVNTLRQLGVDVHVMLAGTMTENNCSGIASNGADSERRLHIHNLNQKHFPVDPRSFDVIHLHSLALSELAVELKTRYDLPLVYTVHSLIPLELEQSAYRQFWQSVQRHILAMCDRAIFVSELEYWTVINSVQGIKDRCCWLPNGLPVVNEVSSKVSCGGPIVFAGRFAENKGINIVVNMISTIGDSKSARFVLAGGHGDKECTRAVKDTAKKYSETVELAGWLNRTQVDDLLASASLVVVPSLYEPFGLVAIEAMRQGTRVLASNVGMLPKIVRPECGGRIVQSFGVTDWVDAANDLMSDQDAQYLASVAGPQSIAENFNIMKITKRLVNEVYRPCVSMVTRHAG